MRPHLYRVILPVSDIDRAEEFYTKLLGFAGERVSPGRHYFDCRGTILACYDPVADGDENGDDIGESTGKGWRPHFNQYIYFAVADLEAAYERVKNSGDKFLDADIATMPWGERLFYARDPFDNPICFVDEKTVFTGTSRSRHSP